MLDAMSLKGDALCKTDKYEEATCWVKVMSMPGLTKYILRNMNYLNYFNKYDTFINN